MLVRHVRFCTHVRAGPLPAGGLPLRRKPILLHTYSIHPICTGGRWLRQAPLLLKNHRLLPAQRRLTLRTLTVRRWNSHRRRPSL